MTSRSSETFAAAVSLFEAAAAESRVESALSEARVAKLRAVAELERAGRYEEARQILDEVSAEQEKSGVGLDTQSLTPRTINPRARR